MKKKQKRIVFRVKWRSSEKYWIVSYRNPSDTTISGYRSKIDAIRDAVMWAHRRWLENQLSQVVIHGKDGKIQREYTYGKDPKRSRG